MREVEAIVSRPNSGSPSGRAKAVSMEFLETIYLIDPDLAMGELSRDDETLSPLVDHSMIPLATTARVICRSDHLIHRRLSYILD
jgi:hypothetical protein